MHCCYSHACVFVLVAVQSEKPADCNTVFLGNLSFNIDENTLREVFGLCGEITDVRWVRATTKQRGAHAVGAVSAIRGAGPTGPRSIDILCSACPFFVLFRCFQVEKDGEFKGCGFVEFAESWSTDEAVKLNGSDVMGRPMRVDYSARGSR